MREAHPCWQRLSRLLIALTLVLGCMAPSHAVVLALDHTGGDVFPGISVTFGWAFSVSSPVTVDALGFFDVGSDGLANSHLVFIARTTSGAAPLLLSATVNNASMPVSSTSTLGRWLFESIAPVVLVPGDYVVFAAGNEPLVQHSDATTISEIIFQGGRIGVIAGLTIPSTPTPGSDDAWFGPNFSVSRVQLAEPSGLVLLAIALAALLLRHFLRQASCSHKRRTE